MHLDVAAFDLEISPLGGGEDLLFGACRQAGVAADDRGALAGDEDVIVRGELGDAAGGAAL